MCQQRFPFAVGPVLFCAGSHQGLEAPVCYLGRERNSFVNVCRWMSEAYVLPFYLILSVMYFVVLKIQGLVGKYARKTNCSDIQNFECSGQHFLNSLFFVVSTSSSHEFCNFLKKFSSFPQNQ